MQEAHKILLEQLAYALFRVPTDTAVTDAVIAEAIQQSVVTLLPIPNHKAYLKMMANNARVEWEHQRVHELMCENGIPYVMMKGIVSAAYYPDPGRRPLGDVDFLVRKEDLPRARKALEAEGYIGTVDKHEFHVAYHAGKSTLELHWQAPGLPENHVIHQYLADLVDKAEFGHGCMCASAFHHGLILLTHSAGHLLSTGIGLRHLCDWAVFYASFSDEAFCELFEQALKDVGLWKYAQLLAQVSIRYLGAPHRKWVGQSDPVLLEEIVEDIFDSGNFGYKDRERINQARLMTDTETRSVGKTGPVRNFLKALARKARMEWPICRKVVFLLPFGMIYVAVRYLYRIARGRRPAIHLKAAVSGAQKRKALYQQFELYKTK